MSDLAKENARLNDRIVSLVSLGEEGQKRTTILEEMVTAMRKELTEANNRCNENRDDIRIVKATIATAPGATSGPGVSRKGVQEDRAVSEAGASTLPAMAADGQHSLGQNTPAPSVCGGGHAGRRDVSRGRGADSVTLGSGGLMGADYRQRREQCDLCGEYSEERDMHPCPRCSNRICTTCSPGYGACPLCDNDARHERTSDAGPIGARPFRGIPMNSENTRGREKCERIVIKGEPQANTIQVWITDVAMQARSAYGFDPDHALKVVSDVLRHPDNKLATKIVYSHLENALFQGLMGCITSQALASEVRVRMMQRNTPLCALRLMKTIIGQSRVSEENEETLYANSLAATMLILTPAVEEEQSLDEFFSRWEMQFVNYIALETRSMTNTAIANQLFLTVKNVKVLAHDVGAWRNLPSGSKTTTWLREKIRSRINIWRSEKNCTIAANAALEVSSGPGYSAMPAARRM